MIICFPYSAQSFEVKNVSFETYAHGFPVDIQITADQSVCDSIAKLCSLGYNYALECSTALYARLPYFVVK